ncbi:MAG TPA: alcohol dehydrogenase catalytic domain-containing protein, partial [Propylenella sp.]|nr:alcohol dehydrogenase catalytic domain-containing protein [Propylenella sp.]
MPAVLILTAPRTLAFETLPEQPLAAGEVRIRTLYSGISAGTELSQYRASSPFMAKRWDEARRLFVPSDRPSWDFPVRNLGYEEVGEIVELGSGVTDTRVGQRVFGTWGHRTHHVASRDYV